MKSSMTMLRFWCWILLRKIESIISLEFIILVLCFTFFQIELYAWDISKNKDGIKVSTRYTKESNLKEFKAEMEVNAPLNKFIIIMEDVSTYPTWMHNCQEAKILKTINKNERITYLVNGASWITQQRDMVIHSKIIRQPATKEILIQLDGKPDFIPPQEDFIRVPRVKGYWRFISINSNKTRAIYQLILEPGGSIPNWLANTTVVDTPFSTMTNLKKLAEEK